MSETPPTDNPRSLEDRTLVDDLHGAVKRQIPILDDKAAMDTFGGDMATSQQELQTARDMDAFLSGRDYTDARGKLHDSETGQFKPFDQANVKPESQTQTYESMSTDDLVTKLAGALEHNDRTMTIDVQDELMERVIAMSGASDDLKERLLTNLYAKAEERSRSTSDNPEDFTNDAAPTEPAPTAEAVAPAVDTVIDQRPAETMGATNTTAATVETPANETVQPITEAEPLNSEDTTQNPEQPTAESNATSESEIDPTDPMHPGYSGLASAGSNPEGPEGTGGPEGPEGPEGPGGPEDEGNPEDGGEDGGTAERNRNLDELQQSLDRIREMLEGIPQLTAELERIQQELDRLRNGETEESGPEEEEEEEEVEPTDEMLATPEAIAELSRRNYYDAINNYAVAKIAAEGMFAGGEKKAAFEAAGAALKEAREQWLSSEANLVRSADRIGEDLQVINNQERAEAQGILDTLLKEKEDAGDDYDGSLEAQIAEQQANLVKITAYDGLIAEHIASREARLQEFATNELTELSKRVDDTMLAERTRRHPKLTKINNWLQKHPKTRIGVGLGLSAMGIVGAATFNAPLVAFATSAKAGLSGYGSYNASRGIGEMIANKKMSKTQLATIDDYLGASDRQSATRRNSKRLGAAVAVAMAAAPAILAMTEAQHAATATHSTHTTGGSHTVVDTDKPDIDKTGVVTPPPKLPMPTITPQGGDEYPWTFGMNNLGTNISAHDTLTKIVNNPYGIKFVGNGMGGGSGAIESVTFPGPDGIRRTFTDFAHINGAIAAIMGK